MFLTYLIECHQNKKKINLYFCLIIFIKIKICFKKKHKKIIFKNCFFKLNK
jgi:hypothetical protein